MPAPRSKFSRRPSTSVPPRKPKTADKLPPHATEIEAAALGSVLLAAETAGPHEATALLSKLRDGLCYDIRHKAILSALKALDAGGHALTILTLQQWGKDHDQLTEMGGRSYIAELPEKTPTLWLFDSDYLPKLQELALRRWVGAKTGRLTELADSPELTLTQLRAEFAEIYETSTRIGKTNRPILKVWKCGELRDHQPPSHLCLVGDNEISMGYDGVTLIAGPGSSGKSLATMSLALAGAIGSGHWMGRKVHRKFKTLIIQAENGSIRLKKEIEALQVMHPKVDIEGHVFVTDPPEGGIPFHSAEFRTAVKRTIEELKPDLVVLDPWSQVAAEDAAKEVVEKLGEIRSCFPAGEECPGLLIVAHTKKPRPEDVRRGRGLTYLISGSVALPNTARCVYVLLPWSDDPTDDRIYWCCPKLNNGQMYAATVWKRRMGTFFEHDAATDPNTFGQDDDQPRGEERQAVKTDQIREVLGDRPGMPKRELYKALEEQFRHHRGTLDRALGKDGYLIKSGRVVEVAGVFALKK